MAIGEVSSTIKGRVEIMSRNSSGGWSRSGSDGNCNSNNNDNSSNN